MIKLIDLPIISELTGDMALHEGGHNFPGLHVVIDQSQTAIAEREIYLVEVMGRDPVLKRCIDRGGSIMLHPVFMGLGDVKTVRLLGRDIPCQSIEFSDSFYKRHVTVLGRLVGFAPMMEGAPS